MHADTGTSGGAGRLRKQRGRRRARAWVAAVAAGALLSCSLGRAEAAEGPRSREEGIVDSYETLLGRPPGESELSFWSAWLGAGGARLELTRMLAQAGGTRRTIEFLYREALGREPARDELEYWSLRVQTGRGTGDVVVGILGSAEARARSAGAAEYVALLYRNVLGREPDPIGGAYWARTAESPGNDTAIVASLWSSAEARRLRIRNAYLAVLGREPDPGGLAYWAGTGLDEPHISARLAATDEFWRPSIPSTLPFTFTDAVVQTTTPLGTEGVLFVVSFPTRLPGEEFCRRIEQGLLQGGAGIAVGCTPQRPFVLGVYHDEELVAAATDLRTFTVTIGSRW